MRWFRGGKISAPALHPGCDAAGREPSSRGAPSTIAGSRDHLPGLVRHARNSGRSGLRSPGDIFETQPSRQHCLSGGSGFSTDLSRPAARSPPPGFRSNTEIETLRRRQERSTRRDARIRAGQNAPRTRPSILPIFPWAEMKTLVDCPSMPTTLDYSLTGANPLSPSRRASRKPTGTNAPFPARPCASCSSAATGPPSATQSSGSPSSSASPARPVCSGLLVGDPPLAIYAVLYASTSDSRWHEAGHGTAFKTDWMNNALYEIASFMVMRESTVWRWSHTRHHSDTIIVGRDPRSSCPVRPT